MCGNPFKSKPPSVEAPAPPAPPAPPAAEPPIAPAYNEADRLEDGAETARRVKRVGRKALRIDLNASGASGDGVQAPRG